MRGNGNFILGCLVFCVVLAIVLALSVSTVYRGQLNNVTSATATAVVTAEHTYPISEAQISGHIDTNEGDGQPYGVNLSSGGSATFHVKVSHAGTYTLTVAHADGAVPGSVDVSVNDNPPIRVHTAYASSFTGYKYNGDADVSIQLQEGDNTITLSNQSVESNCNPADKAPNGNRDANCVFIGGIIIFPAGG